MKKMVLALTAVAAFSAPALAADMRAKAPMMRAAPVAYAPSWTGCYVAGGWGYGMWNQENTAYDDGPPRVQATPTATAGGRGHFGTVQGGCDYQFALGGWNMVVGAFGDYDFADIKGQVNLPTSTLYGTEKLSSRWAVGGRIGALVTPQLLTYVAGGYTEAKFDRTNFEAFNGPVVIPGAGIYIDATTHKGWFIGSGAEYALGFMPGLFWKTEYRYSQFDRQSNPLRVTATNALTGDSIDSEKWTHAVRTQLVYRFNWGGGAVVAKY
ncbi:outer membrane protein [Bradyrhizobium sp.]|uniref:outer membrane protein n=1 Tax=Bradyrhizobium sp. TaxID=376 RepID=UPI00272FAFE9|nr:outer membrane beta-barrel protein [Bradyrhizobium sp.]MDP1869925.1 outer membrane beta-barrel protein [Bradyrhizobium sp.]MDP3075527.1 outer membrane beta-barrel protein [Bradyrhizobium sp.]